MQSPQASTHAAALEMEVAGGFLRLIPYSDTVIRVRFAPTAEFNAKPSLMIVSDPDAQVTAKVSETADAITLSTAKVSVCVNKRTGALTYLDSAGTLLTKEPDRGGKTLIPVDVLKTVFDDSAEAKMQNSVDGVRASTDSMKQVVDRQAFHTKLAFEWQPGEALYGLGSHEDGMLNLRGQHQYLYQQNMKAVVPMLLSTRGYGILRDSYSLMIFHDDAFGSYWWSDVDDELDFYFIYGPEFDQIVHGYRQLTGKAPMLPRWAFGYVQSTEHYATQAELISTVKGYRDRGLPLDCIVQDWKSWREGLWGDKQLDPARYPDPTTMMNEIHSLDARLMISVWPIMNSAGENWREMHDQGCLLGNQATYDAFSEKARALYWKQANDGLFSHGIDAWWCDCTEPFESDWTGQFKPEPEERMLRNTAESKRFLDPQYINAYSLLHSQGIYEGQRKLTADKRVVNLTRSAYAGQQRYSTITWSGDVCSTWDTLRRQVADGLNFCATGMPYWTVDIGAFFVKNDPKLWFWSGDFDLGIEDMGFREIYVRWFQYGAFLPMFRAHGTDAPREVWQFGEPGEPMYEALVKTLRLRYRLLPYIYSLAGMITQADYTIMRALPFDFRADPAAYNVADQYMFGPALLINPVTTPMYFTAGSTPVKGAARTRSVYLPAGSDWYDFWTGVRYTGGQTIVSAAPLDIIPLYVRSGSILPLAPDMQHSGEVVNAPLDLHLYPGQDGHFTLYEDEGDNYNYEQGQFATISLDWDDQNRKLTIGARQGSYPGMPASKQFHVTVVGENVAPIPAITYTGQAITVDLSR